MFNKIDESRIIDKHAWERYRKLIDTASYSGYTEKHHILPKGEGLLARVCQRPKEYRLPFGEGTLRRPPSSVSGLGW